MTAVTSSRQLRGEQGLVGMEGQARDLLSELDAAQGIVINGKRSSGRGSFVVDDPSNGAHIADVADATPVDAVLAVDAAAASSASWIRVPPRQRSEILHRAFELMNEDHERIASLIALENGKALADARAEVGYAAEFFRWFGEEAVRTEGSYGESPAGGTRTLVTHRPVGVAALVTPWNFPAAMATRKLAPALAAGCTVVLKPAAETPLTAIAVALILERAGLPAGVVNVVPTTDAAGVVSAWLGDTRVRKLSFTGSTAVGRLLLRQAADRVLNTSMELGGNAPFVVARDADIPQAVSGAIQAKFRNGGQACTAADRFFVHTRVADEFADLFADAIENLRVGPAASGVDVGPLVSRGARDRVADLVADAVSRGARVAYRGSCPETGWFHPPTLLLDVPHHADIVRAEIFGPVVPMMTWDNDDDLCAMINDCEAGLAGYVFSADLKWAMQLAERIEVGMVGINRGAISDPAAPFGGMKQSGVGREGARQGLREYQETQYFSIDWT